MKSFTKIEIEKFREALLTWYNSNRRLLPWRGDRIGDQAPPPVTSYGIWISEIMLQQTRVETVISYWTRWMNSFPNIDTLACASQEDVNSHWSGLGYYRRAKAISDCAKVLVEKYNSELPQDYELLLSLPGIGPYTAGAISSIAFSNPVPAVDGNVIRVFSRLFTIEEEGPALEKRCRTLGSDIIDKIHPGNFNQALMELGATICKPTNPSCHDCPVQNFCHANLIVTSNIPDIEDMKQIKSVTEYPRKIPKKSPVNMKFIVVALRHATLPSKYLFSRRPPTGLLANQWEFPSIRLPFEEDVLSDHWETAVNTIGSLLALDSVSTSIQIQHTHNEPVIHIFSHQKHHMYLLEALVIDEIACRDLSDETLMWMDQQEVSQRGITTGVKKIFALLKRPSPPGKGENQSDVKQKKRGRGQQVTLDSCFKSVKRVKELTSS